MSPSPSLGPPWLSPSSSPPPFCGIPPPPEPDVGLGFGAGGGGGGGGGGAAGFEATAGADVCGVDGRDGACEGIVVVFCGTTAEVEVLAVTECLAGVWCTTRWWGLGFCAFAGDVTAAVVGVGCFAVFELVEEEPQPAATRARNRTPQGTVARRR